MPLTTPHSHPALPTSSIPPSLPPPSASSPTASSTLHSELAWLASTSYVDRLSAGLRHKLQMPQHDADVDEHEDDATSSSRRFHFGLSDSLSQLVLDCGWDKLNAAKWLTPARPTQRHTVSDRVGTVVPGSSTATPPQPTSFKPTFNSDGAVPAPSFLSRPSSVPSAPSSSCIPYSSSSVASHVASSSPLSSPSALLQPNSSLPSSINSSPSFRSTLSSTSSLPPSSSASARGSFLSDDDDADFAALLANEQREHEPNAHIPPASSTPASALPPSAFHHPSAAASATSCVSHSNTPSFAAPSSYYSPLRPASSIPSTSSTNPQSYLASSSFSPSYPPGPPPTLSASSSFPRTLPPASSSYAYNSSRTSPTTELVRMSSPTLTTVPLNDPSSEWKSTVFPWTGLLYEQNKSTFGNHSFRPLQREIMNATLSGRDVFVLMPTGGGKCFAAGTRLRLYDGRTIAVEDVVVNKRVVQLMGDDGTLRNVTAGTWTLGWAVMYRITPACSGVSPFTVNGDHILVLVNNVRPYVQVEPGHNTHPTSWVATWFELGTDNVMRKLYRSFPSEQQARDEVDVLSADWTPLEWEVSVMDFLASPSDVQQVCEQITADAVTFVDPQLPRLVHVLSAIMGALPRQAQLEWAAWYLGLWMSGEIRYERLCQGSWVAYSCAHQPEVAHELLRYEMLFGEPATQLLGRHRAMGSPICYFNFGRPDVHGGFTQSIAYRLLRHYDLLNNAHIPHAWLCDTLDVRRRILAGLIDGGGSLVTQHANCYTLQARHERVIEGYQLLGRSIGLRSSGVTVGLTVDPMTGQALRNHHLSFTGHLHSVSQFVVCLSKRAPQPVPLESVHMTNARRCHGLTIVEERTPDGCQMLQPYYGFAVDGNRRFLLEDFTVTHNSLCYQLTAIVRDGLTIVFSPLLSLIQDQVTALHVADVPAASLNGATTSEENSKIWRDAQLGFLKLLYITPEKFSRSSALLRLLHDVEAKGKLQAFVIDEAHCVSQWGHDFRPDYLELSRIKQEFPSTPIMALTATASAAVQEQIIRTLQLKDVSVFRQSFNRSNLFYEVRPKKKKTVDELADWIRQYHRQHSGIVYMASRKDCERVCAGLREKGVSCDYYHGKLSSEDRAAAQSRWSNDEVRVMVATMAFGMGINKPDVRFVVHYTFPRSIETYSQETGRAGRDGLPAACVLYYTYADKTTQEFMIKKDEPGVVKNEHIIRANLNKLYAMIRFLEDDVSCRRVSMLGMLGESFDASQCKKGCDNCKRRDVERIVEEDITAIALTFLDILEQLSAHHAWAADAKPGTLLEIFRGGKTKHMKEKGYSVLRGFGSVKNFKYGNVELSRILHELINRAVIAEYSQRIENASFPVTMVRLGVGERARDVRAGRMQLTMSFLKKKQKADSTEHDTDDSEVEETNAGKRKKQKDKKAVPTAAVPAAGSAPSALSRLSAPALSFLSEAAKTSKRSSRDSAGRMLEIDFDSDLLAAQKRRHDDGLQHRPANQGIVEEIILDEEEEQNKVALVAPPQSATAAGIGRKDADAEAEAVGGEEEDEGGLLDYEQLEELIDHLQMTRAHISKTSADHPKPHMIASTKAITHMARELPMDLAELSNTPGFGAAQVRKYGDTFLQSIYAFLMAAAVTLPAHKQRLHDRYVNPQPDDTVDLTMTQSDGGGARQLHRPSIFEPYRASPSPTRDHPNAPLPLPSAAAASSYLSYRRPAAAVGSNAAPRPPVSYPPLPLPHSNKRPRVSYSLSSSENVDPNSSAQQQQQQQYEQQQYPWNNSSGGGSGNDWRSVEQAGPTGRTASDYFAQPSKKRSI